MRSKQRKVLVALGAADHRLQKGVERYAREYRWHLSPELLRGNIIPWGWKGDGILSWLETGDGLAEFVKKAKIPTVDFSFNRRDVNVPRVIENYRHTAQLVAEHFLARGFRRFVFYNRSNRWSCQKRGEVFIEILKQSGYECADFQSNRSSALYSGPKHRDQQLKMLISHLRKSQKPLAIFAADDEQAVEVLEACEKARLQVPENVAIVGAETCLMAPDALRIPISSVGTNLETMGYHGAKLLDDMMSGIQPPQSPVLVPAAGLIIRRSSDILAINHKGIAISLRFIQDRLHESIVVDDLAQAARISSRNLYDVFLKHLGCTPGQALRNARLERAKRMLVDSSNHKLDTVANACGYQSANSLCVTFSRFVGTSPNSFRKSFRG